MQSKQTIEKEIIIANMTIRLSDLMEEKNRLEGIREHLQKEIAEAPAGSLLIQQNNRSRPQFYHSEYHQHKRRVHHIPAAKEFLAKALAQKQYDEKLLKLLEQDIQLLERFLSSYNGPDLKAVYDSLPDIRKQLVQPIFQPDENFITEWRHRFPEDQNSFEKKGGNYMYRGIRMRSKAELLIAQALDRLGIPYIYEPELLLRDKYGTHTIYPDFLILNIRTGETIIYEHFGRMDDSAYVARSLEKLRIYEANGYRRGENLLCSFEGPNYPFDIAVITDMLMRVAL